MFLKRLAPRSLYIRFLLIIIVPMVTVQIVATYMFYERHWDSMSRNMSAALSGEIAMVVADLEKTSPFHHNEIIEKANNYMNLRLNFKKGEAFGAINLDDQHTQLAESFGKYFDYPIDVRILENASDIEIAIQMPTGILYIETTQKRLANPTTYIFIMWMVGTAAILLFVSILFLRNQVRSIVRLTEAAEKFGKGQEIKSFKPQGAKEIRSAAIAFIEMKERIKRLLTRRTQMLAAVSHDLRTPLTRMKLQIAMMQNNDAIEELDHDVKEMEQMLEGYLNFAKLEAGDEAVEESKKTNLANFIKKIIAGYKNHKGKAECKIEKNVSLDLKQKAFKRCITNLIDNALRYSNKVVITAEKLDDDNITIFVDDDGPGIPKKKREKVFQPFYRVEKSRNQETGGVGLGLSIVRDIIHRHGGEIILDTSPYGGLRAMIVLPI